MTPLDPGINHQLWTMESSGTRWVKDALRGSGFQFSHQHFEVGAEAGPDAIITVRGPLAALCSWWTRSRRWDNEVDLNCAAYIRRWKHMLVSRRTDRVVRIGLSAESDLIALGCDPLVVGSADRHGTGGYALGLLYRQGELDLILGELGRKTAEAFEDTRDAMQDALIDLGYTELFWYR